MKKFVGFVGWRGMVGSVLISRMIEENNFLNINPVFFSTSQVGKYAPNFLNFSKKHILQDAYNIVDLQKMDIIITCQGGDYTNIIYNQLRSVGWLGYWIDAASTLRMENDSIIVLDPINIKLINDSIEKGIKTFVGGNCTVSLMLMALGGLLKSKLVENIIFSTYQAASGAGSKNVIELLHQMGYLYNVVSYDLALEMNSVLEIEKKVSDCLRYGQCPKKFFHVPLAGNVLPWIDMGMQNGQTREEWKVQQEMNKILNLKNIIPVDGTCVRVGALRCHSQSFIIKLKKNISVSEITNILKAHNDWIKIIPNDFQSTIDGLTPVSVTGTLDIAVGRIRMLNIGSKYLSIFTVGDQLLWGAAEPIRRMLMILLR
ncbi:aspartate-semialdehyde dehydrogenase [Buchnera aphidicola]|uniref:Aspartate-semialdehyde dehydrogenase n=1 Tax=Buchnera aphidicola (Stegophylla sp.) TaxID=2315800 RepID=A0A4D6Y8Y1_9GAMM|nr:aspartate-semialdehyde dehydrogenase [Buchnera aphidicola (Stegophylla sp.)]QCI26436.1 aspartate-semialdehyde dehydrogenase [Buchnera aphidicola (Stegophylla sp.)]